jgi:hypothetical protein
MNHNYLNIGIGDLLFRPKLGFIDHVGVGIGLNKVLHNLPGKGEHVSTIAEFGSGQPITVRPTGADPVAVAARARRSLANPKRYHLLFRNCQHTVSEILYGVAKSPLAIAALVLVGVVILYFVFKRR